MGKGFAFKFCLTTVPCVYDNLPTALFDQVLLTNASGNINSTAHHAHENFLLHLLRRHLTLITKIN